MRAAPYDLAGLILDHTGVEWTAVQIETPEGKQQYAAAQKSFAQQGQTIRAQLIAECERLLNAVG